MKYENRENGRRGKEDLPEEQARYPLSRSKGDELSAGSGRRLSDVTPEAALAGLLDEQDLQIDGKTLAAQATIAEDAGFPQLAENLRRAAELTRVPNEELLEMYEALRPGRSSTAELETLARRLDDVFAAPITAAFVREASEVYQRRNLLRRRPGSGSQA